MRTNEQAAAYIASVIKEREAYRAAGDREQVAHCEEEMKRVRGDVRQTR